MADKPLLANDNNSDLKKGKSHLCSLSAYTGERSPSAHVDPDVREPEEYRIRPPLSDLCRDWRCSAEWVWRADLQAVATVLGQECGDSCHCH